MHFTDQDLRAAVTAGALDANKLPRCSTSSPAAPPTPPWRRRRASISRTCSGTPAR